MPKKAKKPPEPAPLKQFRAALKKKGDWFSALLVAIGQWEVAEEEIHGRHYQYLIGGEAFDWLLLAERLCEEVNGAIPVDEREALLFFGKPPRPLDDDEFKRAIGDSKHRAHLNFIYGVAVEEALQLTVEEEVLKSWRSFGGWNKGQNLDEEVYEKLYGRSFAELLTSYREELPPHERIDFQPDVPDLEISYGEARAFTYWLFKFRVSQTDPARVASDTRKALAQISELEMAARRRSRFLALPDIASTQILEAEIVASVR
ncbi:MAG: hypothetical protein IIB88_07145 [Chloroflexi bacterium]|nr:hypothetical protein [Chloroflexota bacterium]